MEKNNLSVFPSAVLKKIMSYLKVEEARLKKTKKELLKQDPFVSGNRDIDNSVDTDVAENVEHDRAYALRKQVGRSLIEVRKALTSIKLGKYGLCASCKKMIDTDRLSIKPTAEYCVSCEKKMEKDRRA